MILKDFVFVLGNYQCNKNCPYCIAKMNFIHQPSFEEQIKELQEKIKTYQQKNVQFQYFILSGNGEPSLYYIKDLKNIKDIVESSHLFLDYRIQTSGNLFLEEEKLKLFKNWLKEITVVSSNPLDDQKFYQYSQSYLLSKVFLKQKRIRVNLVLLKDNFLNITHFIDEYAKLNCVETIALKILDNSQPNSKEGLWILEHAISYSEIEKIVEMLNHKYSFVQFSQKRFVFQTHQNKLITLHYSEKNSYDEINLKPSFSWHKRKIKKGIYGTFSKIEEEVEEAKDALEQDNHLMFLIELSDIIGAIEKIALNHHLTLQDLILFSNKVKESKTYEK